MFAYHRLEVQVCHVALLFCFYTVTQKRSTFRLMCQTGSCSSSSVSLEVKVNSQYHLLSQQI